MQVLEFLVLTVRHRLACIEHDENEVTGTRDSDHLATATLTVLSALDDSRQIEELNLAALVLNGTGTGREERKIECGMRNGEGSRNA